MGGYPRQNLATLHIIAWPGLIENIPKGWQLCDGTNGTPDLRSRFVRGPPAGNEAGTTGGSDTVTLDSTMIPSHSHGITDPTHTHTLSTLTRGASGGSGSAKLRGTSSTGSNTATITINNIGGGLSHENRPQFYQCIFICKVSTR